MKLKRKIKPGTCAANRCTETEGLTEVRPGVWLCAKHAAQPIEESAPAPAATSTALVPVEVKAEVVAPLEVEAIGLRDKLAAVTIVNDAQLAACGELAAHLQKRKSETEKSRKSVTGHLVKAKREIDGWFKPAVAAFDAALATVHKAMSDYQMRCAEERRQALAAGDHSTAMAVSQAALPAGTHERRRILWRVTNPAAVPREYWCLDATRIGAVVAQQGLQTSIPGIEAYEDTTLVTRGA